MSKSDADAFNRKIFNKLPPLLAERSEFEIKRDSLIDSLDEVNKILSGVVKTNDERLLPIYAAHKESIEKELTELLRSAEK
jgi:hypothetical protein